VVRAARLHRVRERRETNRTLVEGPNALSEAVDAGTQIVEVFGLPDDSVGEQLAQRSGAEWIPVTGPVLARLAGTETPRGPIAVIVIPASIDAVGDQIWVDTSDPGNAGTLIRSAAAFGFAVRLADEAVDPWSPKAVRAGAGGHFRTPVSVGTPSGDTLRIATVLTGGTPLDQIKAHLTTVPVTLLIGNEARGLSPEAAADADLRVSIPMVSGVESLNASVAGAICMYQISLQRSSVPNH
jgi:TrmH family RNA methyltransferase